MRFDLWRIWAVPTQLETTARGLSPADVLRESLNQEPKRQHSRSVWEVAVKHDSAEKMIFQLGRTGQRTLPTKDDRGDFVHRSVPIAPFTWAAALIPIQVLAIGHDNELSQDPAIPAKALARLLSETSVAAREGYRFAIEPIRNPSDFLTRIRGAYQLKRLWVEVLPPNPPDMDEDFVKPMSRLLRELDAERSKSEWSGSALNADSEVVEEIVRSTTARGADAGATIKETPEARSRRIKLSVGPASFEVALDDMSFPLRLLNGLGQAYDRVRRGHQSENSNERPPE